MNHQRPLFLTVVCSAGFIACFLGMFLIYSHHIQETGRFYAIYRSLSLAFLSVVFGGFWMMRKWAFWGFASYFILNQAVCWFFNVWEWQTLLPSVLIGLTALYYKRME